MSISIKELRIRNFKCYESIDLNLENSTLLLGANNAGKTALLEAIELCFIRYKRISEEIVFLRKDEELPKDREIIIDVLIHSDEEEFSENWFQLFGAFIIDDQFESNDAVAIRTIIKYNPVKEEYELQRKALNSWPTTDEVVDFENFNNEPVTNDVIESIPVFYLDAKRDISTEMDDKYSYWGKLVKDVKLSDDKLEKIENILSSVNDEIIKESDVLKHLTSSLNKITDVLESNNSQVEINPVTRKIKDLNKGMEIKFSDQNSESFSIINQGMGTKSWITFLTLSAYIDWKIKEMEINEKPYHPILLLEEPEAHLHPQAQRKIYKQMKKLKGQKFISTHSPIIAAQATLEEIVHVYKRDGISNLNRIETDKIEKPEQRKINKEVIKSRGDILFADAIILSEGETEEQILPPLFEKYFMQEAFELGVNIVGVSGHGNYKPFMTIARDLGIDLFILSDGEKDVVKKVKTAYKKVYGEDREIDKYVKFLPNDADIEQYLVSEGYEEDIKKVISRLKDNDNFLDKFIQNKNNRERNRKATSETCKTCKQQIYQGEITDYSGEDGEKKALIDYLRNEKTEYSSEISEEILTRRDDTKIPKIIQDLFSSLARKKGYKVDEEFKVNGRNFFEFNRKATENSRLYRGTNASYCWTWKRKDKSINI